MFARRIALLIPLLPLLACGTPEPAKQPAATTASSDSAWVSQSALYEVFVRDFSPTGDFKGVMAGLDRIAATGANVIWLMPIHPVGVLNRKGTLGSSYAVRDYLAVNPEYGTKEDFRALVDSVHRRGMKLIIDWVPNHTSPDNVWVGEHPDFYVRDAQGQLITPIDGDGKPTDWTDVAELDYGKPALRQAMTAAMTHWLVEYGLDGFRVDVAGFVPYDYWREAVPALRASVPRPILLLAEWGDLEMHRLGYDLTYGWDGYARLKAVWKGAPASTFVQGELPQMDSMPAGGARLRFSTNHDETAWDLPAIALFQGPAGARAAFVAITLLPGRPLLYNGQEVESPQKLPLFERDPITWDRAGADSARAFYRRVIELSRTEPDLRSGSLHEVETSAPADIIAYRRGALTVLVNPRAAERRFTLVNADPAGSTDLLSGRAHGAPDVTLPAYGAVVLKPAAR